MMEKKKIKELLFWSSFLGHKVHLATELAHILLLFSLQVYNTVSDQTFYSVLQVFLLASHKQNW